jgi:predicted AAA+ superfamily ATPase
MLYFRNQHNLLIQQVSLKFQRYAVQQLSRGDRVMGVTGPAGTGKTTLLLQYIKQKYGYSGEALYISLDHLYFTRNLFSDLADDFVNRGGIHIFADDVHKYPRWYNELEMVYNQYPGLKITFAGSSLTNAPGPETIIGNNARIFRLPGLSFREYINYTLKTALEATDLEEILEYHTPVALEISKKIKPLKYFEDYLNHGYYPFLASKKERTHVRLQDKILLTIERDLPHLRAADPSKTLNIKQLLYTSIHAAPFKPNISSLSKETGVTRNTLNEYFKYLEEAGLLNLLNKNSSGINLLQKPEQVFPENTNLIYVISDREPEKDALRKTFFLNQLAVKHPVTYPQEGDFLVENKHLFEIGGKNKIQTSGNKNAYIAADDIEVGYENKIPLWLFGFLY